MKNKFLRKACQALSNLARTCLSSLTSPPCDTHFGHDKISLLLLTPPCLGTWSSVCTGCPSSFSPCGELLHPSWQYWKVTFKKTPQFHLTPCSPWCWTFLSHKQPLHNVLSLLVHVSVSPNCQSLLPGQEACLIYLYVPIDIKLLSDLGA